MKRWDIDAPSSSQYHRSPDGEWVEYCDVEKLVAELETLKAVHQDAQAELVKLREQSRVAMGLWRYWRHKDISETDDHWAEFTNAVYALLEGKRVPERFIL